MPAGRIRLIVIAMALSTPRFAAAIELRVAFEPGRPTLSLLDESEQIPASMQAALADDIASQFAASANLFAADIERSMLERRDLLGGGGRGPDPENAWLAFVLGLLPGFGLGHFAIAHDSRGGTRWLIIDIIFLAVWIVLDVAIGAAYPTYGYYCGGPYYYNGCYNSGGWGFWWLLFDLVLPVGWITEHVFQGLSAYRATTGRSLLGDSKPLPSDGDFAEEPRPLAPIFAWGF